MQAIASLLIGPLLLVACDGANFECPRMPKYSDEVQNASAEALEQLPDESPLIYLLGDYAVLRAELRGAGC